MPRRRSARGRRRGGAQRPPIGVPQAPQAAVASPEAPAPNREPSVTRLSTRDYSYVQRELVRVAILATGIIGAIVVLSFFLP